MPGMWMVFVTALSVYAALTGCIFLLQRHLLYHPIKTIAEPSVYGLSAVRGVFLVSEDGLRLEAWTHAARSGFPTIVYFHGNAAHLGDRAGKLSGLINSGFGLVALSYRGFGRSEGNPSEIGIYKDARAAIAYARNILQVPQEKLIYFGESLGTGVAVQMATEQAPGLLALEAAYTSVETRSAELYPFILGVRKLVLDKYDSLSKIKRIHAPLVMLHGQKDTVIPLAHGEALFNAANEPKELVIYQDVHHADYTVEQVVSPLLKAAAKYNLTEPTRDGA